MANGLRYETGRDMPPKMQELAADKLVEQLKNAAPVAAVPEYRCNCGKMTCNSQDYGTFVLHVCDDCRAQFQLEYDCWVRNQRKVDWQSQGETMREKSVVCPYCGYEYGGYASGKFEPGETEETACECCGRKFDVDVVEVRYYTTKRSICEMPENWQPGEMEDI